jgi:pimeloyl-ACP methyl ester carboxylesterase
LKNQDINFSQFPGGNVDAHFYHASGLPVGVYLPFLEILSRKLNVKALHLRPTWPKPGPIPKDRSWEIYADDLINFIEAAYQRPIIAIGHSLGASSTVLAASKRPDLFKALVLVESTQVPKVTSTLIRLAPKRLLINFNPARDSIKKKSRWSSREEFVSEYRENRVYKRVDDQSFDYFKAHMVRDAVGGGVELVYPTAWETISYMGPPFLMDTLCKLDVPIVAVRGKPSVFLSEDSWRRWQKESPSTVFKENLNYGHLFPIEAPEICANLVIEGLEELNLLCWKEP